MGDRKFGNSSLSTLLRQKQLVDPVFTSLFMLFVAFVDETQIFVLQLVSSSRLVLLLLLIIVTLKMKPCSQICVQIPTQLVDCDCEKNKSSITHWDHREEQNAYFACTRPVEKHMSLTR